MKKLLYLVWCTMMVFYACKKDDNGYDTRTVAVQLVYPGSADFTAVEGVKVKMTGRSSSFEASTDATGRATFVVPIDVYEVSATDTRSVGGRAFIFNAVKSGVVISNSTAETEVISLQLEESETSQIVIKEVYVGGVPMDNGSGVFLYDKYVILYNNSATTANLGNLCLATTAPYNAQAANGYYGTDGMLTYEKEGWLPAGQAFWYFQENVTVEPGQQVVIALNNAVNNTITHSKSINFDNPAYYCTYDISKFANASTYVSPAASIPTAHYLKVEVYGAGNAWTLSNTSPGFFIFDPEGYTPSSFAADVSRTDLSQSAYISKKVDAKWVTDGVDAFEMDNDKNKKRLTATIDAGYVYHSNRQGYSIYRNVDAEATKAIEGNEAKLVYNYSYGTTTTDPSGIDAEASIKNGARIIYKDTNNSTNDFHLRSQASLRD